jgi:EmrB/QacA subfamily drug resistance transporter
VRGSFPRTSAADLSWVLNAYSIVYAGMLIPAGGLADSLGPRRIFLLGVALFLVASAACGLAGSVAVLIVARAFQALGAALLTPASLSIILGAFARDRRPMAVGLWGAVGGLSAAIGPSLGSFVVESAGWSWAFYLNLPVGATSLWFAITRLHRDPTPVSRTHVDGIGMLLLIVGVGAIALCIVQSGSEHWTAAELTGTAALGVLCLAGFVAWARRARQPLFDLALFGDSTYAFTNLATLAFGAVFSMMFFGYFFYLTGVWHYGLTRAGLAISPGPLLVMPVAILTARFAARIGYRPFLVGGGLLHACGTLWFWTTAGNEPAYVSRWLPGVIMSGVGVGLVLPSLSAAAVSRLPAGQFAVGSAVNQSIRQVGSVLGVAVIVMLVGGANATHADFTRPYAIQVALALLTAVLCLPVRTRRQLLPA